MVNKKILNRKLIHFLSLFLNYKLLFFFFCSLVYSTMLAYLLNQQQAWTNSKKLYQYRLLENLIKKIFIGSVFMNTLEKQKC